MSQDKSDGSSATDLFHADRRKFIATVGGGLGASLAGCSGAGNGDGGAGGMTDTPGDGGDGSGTDTPANGGGDDGSGQELVWSSNPQGSVTFAMAQGMLNVVNQNTDLQITHTPSGGDQENLGRADRGNADIFLMQAYTATLNQQDVPPFDEIDVKTYQLFHWYDTNMALVSPNDWTEVAEIPSDARVSPAPAGGTVREVWLQALSVAGVEEFEQTSIDYASQGSAMAEGRLDVGETAILEGSIEAGWAQQMKSQVESLNILSWSEETVQTLREDDKFQMIDVDWTQFDGYGHYPEPRDALPTLTMRFHTAARAGADYDAIYEFMNAIFENREALGEYHAVLGFYADPEYFVSKLLPHIPVHPAAADVYEEHGVWRDDLQRGEMA